MEPTKINAPWRELGALEGVHTDSDVLETMWAGKWKPMNQIKLKEVSDRQQYLFRSKSPFPYATWKKEGWTIRCMATQTFPSLSPEIKEAMQRDAQAMGEIASTIPQESQDCKEAVYTVNDVRESQESRIPTEDDLLRFTGMPKTITLDHPWWPRAFTPNKYTRYIPTLDGRKVPVDVYCVLAAFPTGSSAVDHAVKKQLAPGQRGAKSRIQDLKEARDSLTRAIELEEADAP